MARIRSFKPEAPQHRKVGRLSIPARWLWFVMVTQADDEGRLVADPGQLRLAAFGYDRMTDGAVMKLLEEIAATGLVRLYRVEGVPYADFPSWADHQRVDHPAKSKLPSFQHSANPRESSRGFANIPGGSEGSGRDQGPPEGSRGTGLAVLSDGQFLDSLRGNQAYSGIDLERELARMDAWLALPKNRHRKKTRQFIVNWLNRIDRPLPAADADRPIVPDEPVLRRFVTRHRGDHRHADPDR